MEYARQLRAAVDQHKKDLLIVMRVYFEKPRTTVGWKGYINDPRLDGSFRINEGLRRARELRPVLDAADFVLDIHSTRAPVQPFWVYNEMDRNTALASAVGAPLVHLVMPQHKFPGTGVMGYGHHGDPLPPLNWRPTSRCGSWRTRA
ncbi:hypothetical protein G6F24_015750 [Rhizopus arrhizus]|nr:hypothetical protein G6F24_015750 [Rhizopus arrhizus]